MIDLPKNIHIVERGWLSANQIYIHNNSFVDIIDSGFCFQGEQTIQLLQSYLTQNPILKPRYLFNTHLHSDHCGGNRALQDEFHVKCLVPEFEFESLNNWSIAKQAFDDLGQPCPKFTAHNFLKIGSNIQVGSIDFEIHGTPGHNPHSILLFAPSLGLLISADALWEKGFGALFSEVSHQTGFKEQRATLELIKSLPIKFVVPGHGRPFSDIQSALDHAYSRLDYLESSPKRNTLHVAHVLFQFMVMFNETLTLKEGLNWCFNTPLFRKSADQLGLGIDELLSTTLAYLQNKNSLSISNGIIQYRW